MEKIYGASRASLPEKAIMWKSLRQEGALVVSSWIDESGPGETQDLSALWRRIESEIRDCDKLVLFVQEGDLPLKGALVEVGMALALGKPVIVVIRGITLADRDLKPLGSWAKHPKVSFCSDIRKAVGLK